MDRTGKTKEHSRPSEETKRQTMTEVSMSEKQFLAACIAMPLNTKQEFILHPAPPNYAAQSWREQLRSGRSVATYIITISGNNVKVECYQSQP